MLDGGTKDVLERAKKSREADGEGVGCWRVEEHADWLDASALRIDTGDSGRKEGGGNGGDAVSGESGEEVKAVLEKFREGYANVRVSSDEDMKVIKVGAYDVRKPFSWTDKGHEDAATLAHKHDF